MLEVEDFDADMGDRGDLVTQTAKKSAAHRSRTNSRKQDRRFKEASFLDYDDDAEF